MKKKLLLLTLPMLLLGACRHEGLPEGVLTGEQMVDFLTDAYQLEGFYAVETQYRYDSMTQQTQECYDSILLSHRVSREQVEQSFDYYSSHLDVYGVIYDSVVARLEALHDSLPVAQQITHPIGNELPDANLMRRSIPKFELGK